MSEYINNSAKRKELLKTLILDLHQGADMKDVRQRFRMLVGNISGVELARLEQELIEEGLDAAKVQELCDVHVSVFRDALDEEAPPEMTPGHPIHTFKAENMAVEALLKLVEQAVAELPEQQALGRAKSFIDRLFDIDKIYLRKENLLFPFLEQYGVSGPSKVMWGLHDEIRRQLKALRNALDQATDDAKGILPPLAKAIRSMFYKEEHILYPTAMRVLQESDWGAIRDQSEEIGYCLIRPGDQWQPVATTETTPAPATSTSLVSTEALPLTEGKLSLEEIDLLLRHLPVDVTWVDENDRVKYYSEGIEERVFTRSPAIIGRHVQNCHPPKSVHIVMQIVEALKSGERDSAQFWIQMNGRFIFIRYLAMRDEEGRYRGTLEVTQDVTGIRALEGERRLLQWE